MGNARNIAFWVVLLLLVLALFQMFNSSTSVSTQTVPYSDFIAQVDAGEVKAVELDGETVRITAKDGTQYLTIRPAGEQVTEKLLARGVIIQARPQEQSSLVSVLLGYLPFLLLIGVWVYFMNRMQGGGRGGAMGFGKSRAKLLTEKAGPGDV